MASLVLFQLLLIFIIIDISASQHNIWELKICSRQNDDIRNHEQLHQDYRRYLQNEYPLKSKEILLPLTNLLNIHYDTELYFGSSKQPFKLIIDTGSTALWIPDETCNNCKEHNLWKKYSCHKSTTCDIKNAQEEKLEIAYGIGSVEGFGVRDKIYLSDIDLTGFEYDFLLVDKVSDFRALQMQGVIGLGREDLGEFGAQTILGVMKQQGIIDQKVFSLFLSDSASCMGNSALVFGGYNPEYAQTEIQYVPVNTAQHWSVGVIYISFVSKQQQQQQQKDVNNNRRLIKRDNLDDIVEEEYKEKMRYTEGQNQGILQQHQLRLQTFTAVIDSGTSKIIFPKNDLNSLIDVLLADFSISCELSKRSASSEVLTVVCEEYDQSKYPELQFQLGENSTQVRLSLSPVEYTETCMFNLQKRKCILKFLYVPETPFIILGDVLLRKYYTIFDMEKNTIGFSLATIISAKPFYESSTFIAELVLAGVIGLLWGIMVICQMRSAKGFRVILNQDERENTKGDQSDNFTENDCVHDAQQLETMKTEQSEIMREEDQDNQHDFSGEISAEEIIEFDKTSMDTTNNKEMIQNNNAAK